MAGNPDVFVLLEEMLESGKTPEEVCRDRPELLGEVQQRWRQFRVIDAQVLALLPEHGAPDADVVRQVPDASALPHVPGYEVESVLGRGGMGVVYKARHLALKRTVALKMLACSHSNQAHRARFEAEAEAVARLQHPNVVQIHEIGETNGQPFFALEFVEGGSLASRLAGQILPPRDAARLVAALAEAMHLAHSRNLVHRDLKPGNVLLAGAAGAPIGQCQPKVTDFGLVRQLDADSEWTQIGMVMGTPSYMAPEQAEGRANSAGPAADTYALGAILYECLTGRPPFKGSTPLETLEQVRSREPVAPSSVNRQVPRDLETICLKCLRKQPERRYSSARELADDLGRFVRGEPVAARPIGAAERVRKWVCRRPTAAGLLAAVMLLVAAGAVGAWLLYQQQVHQAQTDQEARGVLVGARGLLEAGWQVADLETLKKAEAEGNRAEDIARNGGASTAVWRELKAFREDVIGRWGGAKQTRALLDAVLDVSSTYEANTRDKAGERMVLPVASKDEQYAAAFRLLGLDVDGTAEAEVVARLGSEPDPVVQELIAALDYWMLDRLWRDHPSAEWRRLFRVAEQLDGSEQHRRLRALLIALPWRKAGVAEALWKRQQDDARRELLATRAKINPQTESALTVVLLARGLGVVGDLGGAEKLLREAVTARPDQVVLLMALGDLIEKRTPSRRADAIAYYRQARSHRPRLGIALADALLRAGRPVEVEELMQELVRQVPEHPGFHFFLGVALAQQEKYGAAEASFRKVIELKPDYSEAHNNLGIVLYRLGKPDAAEAAYRKAIEIKPDYAEAYCNLGGVLGAQQKYGAAEAALRTAIDLKADHAGAYRNLGVVLNHRGKPGAAETALRKSDDLMPDVAETHYHLGNALTAQGKHGDAELAFRKAIDLKPDDADAYNNLGRTLSLLKKPGGEAAFRKAIELKPDLAEAHFNLGNALSAQGKHGDAEAAFRKAIDCNPELSEAHYSVGLALIQQRKPREAEAAFRKAIEFKPGFVEAHYSLGLALYDQQKLAEAAFRKAIELKPDFGLACLYLGDALRKQARFDEAAASFKKAGDLLPANHPRREQARQLRQMCQRCAILDAKLPAILRGKEKPADAGEQIEFARLCLFKKTYAASARFFRDAFTAEPKRAEAVPAGARYDAACAAALAGCGQGKDADKLDDKERAVWRSQALDWLRQDLTWWGNALDNGTAQTKAQVQQKMRHWQADGDFADVRARDGLARLPDEERKQWGKLWSDVDALLRRASEPE